jgi:hypothetical protein
MCRLWFKLRWLRRKRIPRLNLLTKQCLRLRCLTLNSPRKWHKLGRGKKGLRRKLINHIQLSRLNINRKPRL